jgi:hypothetical protein
MDKIISIQLISKTENSMLTLVNYEEIGIFSNSTKIAYCLMLLDEDKGVENVKFAHTGRCVGYRFESTFLEFYNSDRDFFNYTGGNRSFPEREYFNYLSKKKGSISNTPPPKPSL